jgi:hypothetical protein
MSELLQNRRNFIKTFLLGSIAGTSVLAFLPQEALSEEKDIDLEKVPPKVRSAADKAVPGAKWTGAIKEEDESEVIYELEGTDGKGQDVTVEVTASGEVEGITTEISLQEVPVVVMTALQKKMPHFKATSVTELREDGEVDSYTFEGKRPKDKEEIDVYVSADGETIEIEG